MVSEVVELFREILILLKEDNLKNQSLHDFCVGFYEQEEINRGKVLTKEEAFELFATAHAYKYADKRFKVPPELYCLVAVIFTLLLFGPSCYFSKILTSFVLNHGIIIP